MTTQLERGDSTGDHYEDHIQNNFQYFALDGSNSIRLLRLHPGKFEDPIKAELFTTSLSAAPTFEAVSYVWGSLDTVEKISLNDRDYRITVNLAYALRQVRLRYSRLVLWVDQLCIDQQNLDERADQVALMADIYKSASRVYLSLGPDRQANARAAFRTVRQLQRVANEQIKKYGSLEKVLTVTKDLEEYDNFSWAALGALNGCEWFERVWCVQEVGLAKEAVLLWGDDQLDWMELMFVQQWLSGPGYYIGLRHSMQVTNCYLWISYDTHDRALLRNRMQSLLDVFASIQCGMKASDPRDYVFAFLGHPLATPSELGFTITPQYQSSAGQLYLEFATNWLIANRSSLLLYHVKKLKRQTGDLQRSDCPSWCPKWDISMPTTFTLYPGHWTGWYNASLSTEWAFKIDGPHLRTRGFIFDKITTSFWDCSQRTSLAAHRCERNVIPRIVAEVLKEDGLHSWVYRDALQALATCFSCGLYEGKFNRGTASDLKFFAGYVLRARELTSVDHSLSLEAVARLEHAAGDVTPLEWDAFATNMGKWCSLNSLFATETGYMVLGPCVAMPEDVVCIISGCPTPFILRPSKDSMYTLVGACFVQGIMRGEALDMFIRGERKMQEFVIH